AIPLVEGSAAVAEELWTALESAGVQPAGLGARDTLRLEAALPLHGQELGPDITPLQAGLKWVVAFDKDNFRGKAALEAELENGVPRRLVGLEIEGRRPLRTGMDVKRDGVSVGAVTSGNFSPVLGHGIALAFVSVDVEIGDVLQIDQRGADVAATVVATPFVKASPSTYSFS
ncbi:MAG: glycine cleavage T C-terminal barrel domain-containing protein, partial [Acidimicrobiales bacterium]